MKNILKISNLHVEIDDNKILHGLNLEVKPGEIHYLMGKNGAGKSTVAKALMGHPGITITKGSIRYKDKNLINLLPDKRSHLGIYLANQYPVEVPGVNMFNFLRIAYNSRNPQDKQLSVFKFKKHIQPILELLNIDNRFLRRNLNEGLSGGEKKKNEVLQMAILEPDLVILDETDSGLDVDSIAQVFTGISKLKGLNKNMSLIIITHYSRVLKFLTPDYVHIVSGGKIVRTGDIDLAKDINKYGYKNN